MSESNQKYSDPVIPARQGGWKHRTVKNAEGLVVDVQSLFFVPNPGPNNINVRLLRVVHAWAKPNDGFMLAGFARRERNLFGPNVEWWWEVPYEKVWRSIDSLIPEKTTAD